MLYTDLQHHVLTKPFRPFRITMTDGGTHDVRFREAFILTPTYLLVGLLPNSDGSSFERTVILDMMSITSIEYLSTPVAAQGNGQASS